MCYVCESCVRKTEGEKDADVIERLGQPFISLYMVAGSGGSQPQDSYPS
jgi:hypothetical protein